MKILALFQGYLLKMLYDHIKWVLTLWNLLKYCQLTKGRRNGRHFSFLHRIFPPISFGSRGNQESRDTRAISGLFKGKTDFDKILRFELLWTLYVLKMQSSGLFSVKAWRSLWRNKQKTFVIMTRKSARIQPDADVQVVRVVFHSRRGGQMKNLFFVQNREGVEWRATMLIWDGLERFLFPR